MGVARGQDHFHPFVECSHGLGERNPTHSVRHDDVGKHQLDGIIGAQHLQRLVSVTGDDDVVPEVLNQFDDDIADLLIVLDDEILSRSSEPAIPAGSETEATSGTAEAYGK